MVGMIIFGIMGLAVGAFGIWVLVCAFMESDFFDIDIAAAFIILCVSALLFTFADACWRDYNNTTQAEVAVIQYESEV